MAGSWPDTPGRKIAYHADGTVVAGRWPENGAPYENFYDWEPGATGLQELNDLDFSNIGEDWPNRLFTASSIGPSGGGVNKSTENVWIFPELRDLYGYSFILNPVNTGTGGPGTYRWYTSPDTTNGIDGTWTQWGDDWDGTNLIDDTFPENWREGTYIETRLAQRAVRCHGTMGPFTPGPTNWKAAFLFGEISAGETPDRILFIDSYTGLEFTGPMDWGDVPRGATLEWDIYLLNNSTTLQANTMTLDFTTLYNSSDTWYEIKEVGGSYAATHAVASIAASARYPAVNDLRVKLDVPDDEALSIYEAILELSVPASWT